MGSTSFISCILSFHFLYIFLTSVTNLSFHVTEIPSKPGRPEVVEIGDSFVSLHWEPPVSDGGCEVLHYVIERREVTLIFKYLHFV